jgi:hydroxymethylpyrimidine/phosphomethylpyrimidine kinase
VFTSALSIAGSDPTGGAGLQLDLRVFTAHGVHGMAIPTALTVQTTRGVSKVLPAFPSVVGEQLAALLSDLRPGAIKLGMLATDDVLLRVAQLVEPLDAPRVVDPVLRASSGPLLLERRAWGSLLERIVPGCALVTPNLDEAQLLVGERDPARAARLFREAGARAVLVKGGHAEGAPDDYLLDDEGEHWLRGARRGDAPVHGTGCALSAAIAARLARGEPLRAAIEAAKRFVEDAIASAVAPGSGAKLLAF